MCVKREFQATLFMRTRSTIGARLSRFHCLLLHLTALGSSLSGVTCSEKSMISTFYAVLVFSQFWLDIVPAAARIDGEWIVPFGRITRACSWWQLLGWISTTRAPNYGMLMLMKSKSAWCTKFWLILFCSVIYFALQSRGIAFASVLRSFVKINQIPFETSRIGLAA